MAAAPRRSDPARRYTQPYLHLMLTTQQAYELVAPLYADRLDRVGIPEIEHLRAVAAGLPSEQQPLGWLHDAFEDELLTYEQARSAGASDRQIAALLLLDRNQHPGTYLDYIEDIAKADGPPGADARRTKLEALKHNTSRPCPEHLLHMRRSRGAHTKARFRIESAMRHRGEMEELDVDGPSFWGHDSDVIARVRACVAGLPAFPTMPVPDICGPAEYYREVSAQQCVVMLPVRAGRGLVILGEIGREETRKSWRYASSAAALLAAEHWDGQGDPADGWCWGTNWRYRLEGDPARESHIIPNIMSRLSQPTPTYKTGGRFGLTAE